jgi:TetR/AcrR family transcriptional regulator, cholesterol catabolism regulator
MKNIKNSIIHKASLLFAQNGIQPVSMDDVAKECGLSNKTIYLLFPSKEEIVLKVVETQLDKTQQYLSIYSDILSDAVTELNNFFGCIEKMLDIFTPTFLLDLKKYFPDLYLKFETFKNENMIPFIHQNINRGITEETYRLELKKDFVGKMYSWELLNAMKEKVTYSQSGNQLIYNIHNLFLYGLLNSKGKRLLLSKIR